jgi:hypothetical protein
MNNGFSVLSPLWSEHFKSEVGQCQPPVSSDFQSPLELYTYVRDLFACDASFSFQHPWMRTDPLLCAISVLAGYSKEPFVPKLERPLPLALSCQLALMWNILGYNEEASVLAASLEPLILEGFTTLWASERQFNEGETTVSAALLLIALGKGDQALDLYNVSLPKDRFLGWLFDRNTQIEPVIHASTDYQLVHGVHTTYVFSLVENQVQVGALKSGLIQIPAFGPHLAPLSNGNLFGIGQLPKNDGWFCASAAKETWFKVDTTVPDTISLQAIGVDPDKPTYFVFYVKADDCTIHERLFKPKSLNRFSGESTQSIFRQGTDRLAIQTDRNLTTELIPLSGGVSFWGATFMLCYKMPSLLGKVTFSFSKD